MLNYSYLAVRDILFLQDMSTYSLIYNNCRSQIRHTWIDSFLICMKQPFNGGIQNLENWSHEFGAYDDERMRMFWKGREI